MTNHAYALQQVALIDLIQVKEVAGCTSNNLEGCLICNLCFTKHICSCTSRPATAQPGMTRRRERAGPGPRAATAKRFRLGWRTIIGGPGRWQSGTQSVTQRLSDSDDGLDLKPTRLLASPAARQATFKFTGSLARHGLSCHVDI